MPVQTQILTRRGAAATWTSTNPTLGAGEIGFESDTNKFKIGTGSTAWVSLPYASNVSPLTTKGDLYTYSTDNDRLAVGANGETLVADSSTSTGLRYEGNYAAGKNKIINGDFGIWQRGTSFSDLAGGSYITDRFRVSYDGTAPTSRTYSQQTFTLGAAPVAGYEGRFFARASITTKGSNTNSGFAQLIEDVRTFAGQTVTVSFYAKCDTARTGLIQIVQGFGTGGSPSSFVVVTNTSVSYTSSWARYTLTIAIPSISGKTIGTNNDSSLAITLLHTSADGSTFDIWGVQAEAGSVATAFQTATGTIQGELAACQRYYRTNYFDVRLQGVASASYSFSATAIPMRTAPTAAFTAAADYSFNISGTPIIATTNNAVPNVSLRFAATGNGDLYYGRPYELAAEL